MSPARKLPLGTPEAVRFWSCVEKGGACWEWRGYVTPLGYGRFNRSITRLSIPAHRLAWELQIGPVPPGLCVCHRCDNRKCVRGDHLFLGTHGDNMRDCAAKGRTRNGMLKGGQHGMAKLNDRQATEIRSRYRSGGVTQRELAAEYGVTRASVQRIATGKSWKHLAETV